MRFRIEIFLRKDVSQIIVILAFIFISSFAFSQNGTYELKNNNGSYCYISVRKVGKEATAEIFAWWNTPSAQTGSYFGKAQSSGNKLILKSDENDPDCKVILMMEKAKIRATFDKCTMDHLPEDFNGVYTKITDATSGDYIVSASKIYFHTKPSQSTQQKTYLVKGDKVTLNIDSIIAGDWVYVYYTNQKGKEYKGYVELKYLKRN